jgi:hypothetical protein
MREMLRANNHGLATGFFLSIVSVLLLGTLIVPAGAFILDSVSFRIHDNGDADAAIRFRLEGFVENAIPDSILESEIKKGLTTDPGNPPALESFSRSQIVLLMPHFASSRKTREGTEYMTTPLDFTRAETALKQSALSYLVTADFTPSVADITFPDSYVETFHDVALLSSVTHLVRNPETVSSPAPSPAVSPAAFPAGSLAIRSAPPGARITLDGTASGTTPGTVTGIPEGDHRLDIAMEGYAAWSATVSVGANATTQVFASLAPVANPATPEPVATGKLASSPLASLIGIACAALLFIIPGYRR